MDSQAMDSQAAVPGRPSAVKVGTMNYLRSLLLSDHPDYPAVVESCVKAVGHCRTCYECFAREETVIWDPDPAGTNAGFFHENRDCFKGPFRLAPEPPDIKLIKEFVLRGKTRKAEVQSGYTSSEDVPRRPPRLHRHRRYRPPIGSPPTARRR